MPSGFVTTRSLARPAPSTGVLAVIVFESVTTRFVTGCPPIVTLALASKSVPLIEMLVPPAGGPAVGLTLKGSRCENSDVLPAGSVAVAAISVPASVATGSVTSNAASPLPSVVVWPEPR